MRIYIINYDNILNYYNLEDEYILFVNYNNLEILKVNVNGLDENLINGVFMDNINIDINNTSILNIPFNGVIGNNNLDLENNLIVISDNKLYYTYNNDKYLLINCLYRFNFINNDSKEYLIYTNFINSYDIFIIDKNLTIKDGTYQGFFGGFNYKNRLINILLELKTIKNNNYIYNNDVILNKNDGKIYKVKVDNNNIIINNITTGDKIFFIDSQYYSDSSNNSGKLLYYENNNGVYTDSSFGKVINGKITNLPISDYNNNKLQGELINNPSNGNYILVLNTNYNEIILSLYDNNLYIIGLNYPIIYNNTKITFNADNFSTYTIITDDNNNKIITSINTKIYYQGYYTTNIFDKNNVGSILEEIMSISGRDILVGDSLLCKTYDENNDETWIIFRTISQNDIVYKYIYDDIFYYNNKTSNIILIKDNIVIDDDELFDNTNNVIIGNIGSFYPKTVDVKYLYFDTVSFKFYKYYIDKWLEAELNLINVTFKNISDNSITNLNMNDNFLIDIHDDINSEYKTYYTSNNISINELTYEIIYNSIYDVKINKPKSRDLLLIKVDNIYTIFRIDSTKYQKYSTINSPDIFYYNNSSNNTLYFVDKYNNNIEPNNFIYDNTLEGYYNGIVDPPEILDENSKKYYFDGNNLYMLYKNNNNIYSFIHFFRVI